MPVKKDPKKKNSKGQDTRAKKKTKVVRSVEVETPDSGGGEDSNTSTTQGKG